MSTITNLEKNIGVSGTVYLVKTLYKSENNDFGKSIVKVLTFIRKKTWSAKRLLIAGIILIIIGSLLGWYAFPKLIHSQIASNINLKEGTDLREMWSNFPDPVGFKVYFFNVTNPMEIQKGAKPVLSEIGPYVYDEYKHKAELYDHDEDDSVSFNNRDTWYFNRMKSAPLTGDEIITIPHLLLLGMVLSTEKDMKPLLPVITRAIPHIFGNSSSVFMTATAREILFDGILISCNVKDFAAKALCTLVKTQGKDLEKVGKTDFKFSFFGKKNGSLQDRLRLKRGIENVMDIGRVVAWKEQKRMTVWSAPRCNEFSGTDGSIFPPFLEDGNPIKVFAADLCRSLVAAYGGKTEYKGISGNIYSADFGDPSNDPNLKCFCTTPRTCLKRGVHDLTRCTGAPLVVSLPHFYLAHEDYLDDVKGLHPQKRLHETALHFEPLTGTPLLGYKRLQFNIMIHKVAKFDLMKSLPTVVFPILWADEGLELDDKYVSQLKSIFLIFKVIDAIKWTMIVIGGVIVLMGLYLVVQKMTMNAMVALGRNSPEVSPLEVETPTRTRY